MVANLKTWQNVAALALLLAIFALLQACSNDATGEVGAVSSRDETAESGQQESATPEPPPDESSVPATFTPVPTITQTPTPGPSATPTKTLTPSPAPTDTPAPTATPTSIPQQNGGLAFVGTPYNLMTATPSTPVPTAVPRFEVPDEVTNILLLGSDQDLEAGISRTDTMIIVSVNRRTKTASMVSLPRDMYVYIPGWNLNRINTALARGSNANYPTGAIGQLKDTILYNFGVPIHYFARIDIEGFQEVVDALGGIELPVSCPVDIPVVKSREPLEIETMRLEPGIHEMDGELALWYARSRTGSTDFDRNRRQQQLLHALFNHGVDVDLLSQIPTLYNTYKDTVETDMDIGRILQLAAIAPAVRENGIQHLYISGDQLQPWIEPVTGAQVQLPQWEGEMEETFYRLFTPPSLNSGLRAPIYVEVVNGTDNPELALLAADNLAWYGFVPVITQADRRDYESTTISYYADNFKSSFDWLISWIFSQRSEAIELIPDTPYEYDYRVVLGADYDPCVNQLNAPQEFLP